MCMKKERERWVMWSEKLRFLSKITPKLRTEEFEVNVWVNEESRLREIDGSGIFFSCSRRPMSINSVFEGFRQRRFEVIQEEICLTTYTLCLRKNCAKLFLLELCQIFVNFNNFWQVEEKMAKIICHINMFHLTSLMSSQCLVKQKCAKFLHNA